MASGSEVSCTGRACSLRIRWSWPTTASFYAVSNPLLQQDAAGSSAVPLKGQKLRRSFSHWSKQRKPTRRTLIITWNTCWRHFPARRSLKQTLSAKTVCPGQTRTGLMSRTRRRLPCVSLRTSALPSAPGRPVGKNGVHKGSGTMGLLYDRKGIPFVLQMQSALTLLALQSNNQMPDQWWSYGNEVQTQPVILEREPVLQRQNLWATIIDYAGYGL